MNDGLVVLAGWLQWAAIVALLLFAVLRNVADHHERRDAAYERRPRDPRTDRSRS